MNTERESINTEKESNEYYLSNYVNPKYSFQEVTNSKIYLNIHIKRI